MPLASTEHSDKANEDKMYSFQSRVYIIISLHGKNLVNKLFQKNLSRNI